MNITKKIAAQGGQMSENQYRKIKDRLSYSSIKLFDTDRRAFYDQIIMGNPRKEKESISLTMGRIVHLLLSEPNAFDEHFQIAGTQRPSGQMGDLTDALVARAMKSMDADGIQQDKFSVLFSDAFNSVKYDYEGNEISFKKKDMEWALERFEGKDGEQYYKECMENMGKTVVSTGTIEAAEKIVDKIRVHPYTADIANLQSGGEVEVFNELPILFELEGVEYKAMVDKLIVSHVDKTICIYDWKTSFDVENTQFSYLKYGYYLQSAMYYDAVEKWAIEHNLVDYQVNPIVFIFCDTQGFADPVLLDLSMDDIERAHRGFTYRGVHYNGLRYLQEEIQYCLETGKWGTTRELEKNNGKVKLNLRYGSQ